MDWSLLAINIASGAAVGFVTNALAIRMLFHRYPLIGGGEMVKDREQLENAMSTLVEERLIRPETVLEEFDKDGFKQSFEHLLTQIIGEHIPARIAAYGTLDDIGGFAATTENLRTFLLTHRDTLLGVALDSLYQHIQMRDLLTDEQLAYLIDRIFDQLAALLEQEAEPALQALLAELSSLPVSELLPPELLPTLVSQLLTALPEALAAHPEMASKALQAVYEMLVTPEWLEALTASLQTRTLAELLGETNSQNAARELIERLQGFLNSPPGTVLLTELVHQGLSLLATLETPLAALLSPAIEERLLALLAQHLPEILDRLEAWLVLNRDQLEAMIRASVDTHLRSENVVKQLTVSIFSEQITERYRLIEKVIAEIRRLASQSQGDLVSAGMQFLNTTRISDVVSLIGPHLLDPRALSQVLLHMINAYLPRLQDTTLEPFLHRPLRTLPVLRQLALRPLVEKHLWPWLKQQLQHWLQSPAVLTHLQPLIDQALAQLQQQPLAVVLPPATTALMRDLLVRFVTSPRFRDRVCQQLEQDLPDLLQGKALGDFVSPGLRVTLLRKLGDIYSRYLGDFLMGFQREKVGTLYARIAELYREWIQHADFARPTREALVGFMIQLIRDHRLFDGKIRVTVKESFGRFSDAELEAEMEGFMGEELKPITWLGAALGAAVGVAMTAMDTHATAFTQGWPALITYPGVYALTGVWTNWLAIRMLFRPYTAKQLLGFTLPFTPGVFVRNKPQLGDTMARFIDQKLLSKDNMVKILEKYQMRWKEVIQRVLSENNYAALDQTLHRYADENYESLTPLLLRTGFRQIYEAAPEITAYLIEEAQGLELGAEDLQLLEQELLTQISTSRPLLMSYLLQQGRTQASLPITWLEGQMEPLLQALWAGGKPQLLHWLAHESSFVQGVSAWEKPFAEALQQPLGILHLDQLLGADVVQQLLQQILGDPDLQTLLQQLTRQVLTQGLAPDTPLQAAWGGRLYRLLEAESGFVIQLLSSYLLEAARTHRHQIVRSLAAGIERQGLFEVVLVNFGGVRSDIRGVVDVLVDQYLEPWLQTQQTELRDLFLHYLHHGLAPLTPHEIGLQADLFNAAHMATVIRERVLENPAVQIQVAKLLSAVVQDVADDLNGAALLEPLGVGSLNALYQRFEPEVRASRTYFQAQAQQPLSPALLSAAQRLLTGVMLQKAQQNLSDLVPTALQRETLEVWTHYLYTSPAIRNASRKLIGTALAPLSRGQLNLLVDQRILARDVRILLQQLTTPESHNLRSQGFQYFIQQRLRNLTLTFIEVLNQTLVTDTKQALEDIFVDSLIEGLREHNREVLEPIDFDGITRREVLAMDPARIEALFDFAKPIFKALTWYGMMGGVVGIVAGILAAW